MGRLIAALFALSLVGMGTLFHVTRILVPAWRERAALAWTPATCTILHSELIEGTDSEGDTTYHVDIRYSWTADGVERHGDRVDFSPDGPGGSDARDAVTRFRRGKQVRCWIDPAAPGEAVLMRGGLSAGAGLFALIFQIAGLGVLYGVLARPNAPRTTVHGGWMAARPRWGRHLAIGGGALVVAVELGFGVHAMLGLDRPWSVAVYVLVGLGALALAAHQLGQVATGLEISVSPVRLPLGEVARLRWWMRAPFGVARGRVRLIARERVGRGSGSDATVTEHVLHEAHIAALDRAHAGDPVEVRIPRASLPTLEVGRASVTWTLAVHAELPRWPDLDLEVPIEVAPVAASLPRRPPRRAGTPALDGPPRLVLDRAGARYAPGEAITGVIGWTAGVADTVRVELRRRTGVVAGDPPVDEVIETIDVASLPRIAAPGRDGPYRGTAAAGGETPPLDARDLRELWLVAPAGPVSWRSAQIAIAWRLVLVVDGAEVADETIELVDADGQIARTIT